MKITTYQGRLIPVERKGPANYYTCMRCGIWLQYSGGRPKPKRCRDCQHDTFAAKTRRPI